MLGKFCKKKNSLIQVFSFPILEIWAENNKWKDLKTSADSKVLETFIDNVLKANMANYKILQDESKMKKRWDKFALSI